MMPQPVICVSCAGNCVMQSRQAAATFTFIQILTSLKTEQDGK